MYSITSKNKKTFQSFGEENLLTAANKSGLLLELRFLLEDVSVLGLKLIPVPFILFSTKCPCGKLKTLFFPGYKMAISLKGTKKEIISLQICKGKKCSRNLYPKL